MKGTEISTEIDLKKATVIIADNDLVVVRIKKNQLIERRDIYDIFNAHQRVFGETKRYVLFVTDNSSAITADGREASSEKKLNQFAFAKAVVVKNLANKLVVNFFIRVDKPEALTRAFDSEERAMAWINELRKSNHH